MRAPDLGESICACSTTLPSPIAVIRVSGEDTFLVLKKLFPRLNFKPNMIEHTQIPLSAFRDDAMVWTACAPHTYTGEDYAELMVHGSTEIVGQVLDKLHCEGLRDAQPGEFTFRAYVNGKQSLMQAASISLILGSQTQRDLASTAALRSHKVDSLLKEAKERAMALYNALQVTLDYSEQGYVMSEIETQVNLLAEAFHQALESLSEDLSPLLVLSQVPSITIIGAPNAGKSTLFNKMVGFDRVITSEHPGTTRDYVSHMLVCKGRKFDLVDTAGLRETDSELEKIGINGTKKSLNTAQGVIWVLPINTFSLEKAQTFFDWLMEQGEPCPLFILGNKVDLASHEKAQAFKSFCDALEGNPYVTYQASCLLDTTKSLLDDILLHFYEHIDQNISTTAFLPNAIRSTCLSLLKDGKACLHKLEQNEYDLAHVMLENLFPSLSLLTGEIAKEELYERLFSSFCLGK